MSVYSVKGKGWRFDFWMKGIRYANQWFSTKREGQEAEAEKRKELKNPKPVEVEETPTVTTFKELMNMRLDFIQVYGTAAYYKDNRLLFQRLNKKKKWGEFGAGEITKAMVQKYVLERAKESHYASNYDIRLLKALFNFGIKSKMVSENPVVGIPFLPVDKKIKYVPAPNDIDLVMELADCDTQDYLWVIRETMARMGEVNQLVWDDVSLDGRYVVLHTRKKRGGHRTPRKVPMTQKLFEVLSRRYGDRDPGKSWVFWQRYWCRKTSQWKEGPYIDRDKFMKTLCREAGVKYFRFHALRHAGASLMDGHNVPVGAIQEILGHENRSTTEIYLHSVSGAAQQAMMAYEAIRQKSHTKSHTID